MALLSDENGLSIAKTGRTTELDLDSNAITSVSAASFSSSEENWNDLGIRDQIIADLTSIERREPSHFAITDFVNLISSEDAPI